MTGGAQHEGHRERLRERLEQEGLRGFAPHEVLELLLTYAIPRGDVNPLAHALMRRFGSLSGVLEAKEAELRQVSGIGSRAASLLALMLPLFQKYQMEKLTPKQRIETVSQLMPYCRTLFMGSTTEAFYVICLDGQMNVLSVECVNTGTPMEVNAAPRLVARFALRRDAFGVVITHNHPSGNLTPSQEDLDVTRQIGLALASMDIRLYDHVIVGAGEAFSFQQHGLLDAGRSFMPMDTRSKGELAADRPQRKLPPRRKK